MRTACYFLINFWLLVGVMAEPEAGMAWLGIRVAKPDEVTAMQLPALPPGIGFVVVGLEEGGPAERDGMRKLDLCWKMNEQLLVNEGQLATLLRLAVPGEQVTISIFREGKPIEVKVTLGTEVVKADEAITQVLNDSVMRQEDGALRIVNVERKTVTIENEKGRAEVSRAESGDSVEIKDLEGKMIFQGVLGGRPEDSAVPGKWRRQVCALRRALDHALSAKAAPVRQPRQRILAPGGG